jgi:hypothetical protein
MVPGAMLLAALLLLATTYGFWFRRKLSESWVRSIVAGIEMKLEEQRAARKAK